MKLPSRFDFFSRRPVSRAVCRCLPFAPFLALGFGSAAATGAEPGSINVRYIGRIGLFDGPEFTSADGSQSSGVTGLTESGFASGWSGRFNGGIFASGGNAAWVADASTGTTTRVGLFNGPEFTRANGSQYSEVTRLTESGFASGWSSRFNGALTAGDAAWVADASTGTTVRVGFFADPRFTATNGSQLSAVERLTESGLASGWSQRYTGSQSAGQAAWVANVSSGTTTRVGLFAGPEFTATNGTQHTRVTGLTESGLMSGESRRFRDNQSAGQAAWVRDVFNGPTTRVGFFTGPEFTATNGTQYSTVDRLTESGFAGGSSWRYNSGEFIGNVAWVANVSNGATIRVGLFTGPEFTGADGTQISTVERLTESGLVSGSSWRFNGGFGQTGEAAWVANAATGTTTRVGFFNGPEFTGADGYRSSTVTSLTESGFAGGSSLRFIGGEATGGNAAWVANVSSGTTTRVGLFNGTEFTRTGGEQGSTVTRLTESGFAGGSSQRYDSFQLTGEAAWVANVSTGITTRVGIADSAHTRADDYQFSTITLLLDSGEALGYSSRYHDWDSNGQTAWIFSTVSGLQTDFVLSIRPSDGYAYSSLAGITENGLAFGSYELFDGETALGSRAFLWSEDSGVLTLDEEVSGGVAQYGWEHFFSAEFANGDGYIIGTGSLSGGGMGVYLVQIPEPSAALLALLAALPVFETRRRS